MGQYCIKIKEKRICKSSRRWFTTSHNTIWGQFPNMFSCVKLDNGWSKCRINALKHINKLQKILLWDVLLRILLRKTKRIFDHDQSEPTTNLTIINWSKLTFVRRIFCVTHIGNNLEYYFYLSNVNTYWIDNFDMR